MCLSLDKVCDRNFDCFDGSDEAQCKYITQRRSCRDSVITQQYE